MQIGSFLEVVTFVSAILTILLILLQQRGASLGAGFGSSGELYTTRRGLDNCICGDICIIYFGTIINSGIIWQILSKSVGKNF